MGQESVGLQDNLNNENNTQFEEVEMDLESKNENLKNAKIEDQEELIDQINEENKTDDVLKFSQYDNTILLLNLFQKPSISQYTNDSLIQYVLFISRLFETFFESLPQFILQVANNLLISSSRLQWDVLQYASIITSLISLLSTSIELIDFLLSKRVQTFISVQNDPEQIVKFKDLYQSRIQKIVVNYENIDLIEKLINIDEKQFYEASSLQEMDLKLIEDGNNREQTLKLLYKLFMLKYPENFKQINIEFKNTGDNFDDEMSELYSQLKQKLDRNNIDLYDNLKSEYPSLEIVKTDDQVQREYHFIKFNDSQKVLPKLQEYCNRNNNTTNNINNGDLNFELQIYMDDITNNSFIKKINKQVLMCMRIYAKQLKIVKKISVDFKSQGDLPRNDLQNIYEQIFLNNLSDTNILIEDQMTQNYPYLQIFYENEKNTNNNYLQKEYILNCPKKDDLLLPILNELTDGYIVSLNLNIDDYCMYNSIKIRIQNFLKYLSTADFGRYRFTIKSFNINFKAQGCYLPKNDIKNYFKLKNHILNIETIQFSDNLFDLEEQYQPIITINQYEEKQNNTISNNDNDNKNQITKFSMYQNNAFNLNENILINQNFSLGSQHLYLEFNNKFNYFIREKQNFARLCESLNSFKNLRSLHLKFLGHQNDKIVLNILSKNIQCLSKISSLQVNYYYNNSRNSQNMDMVDEFLEFILALQTLNKIKNLTLNIQKLLKDNKFQQLCEIIQNFEQLEELVINKDTDNLDDKLNQIFAQTFKKLGLKKLKELKINLGIWLNNDLQEQQILTFSKSILTIQQITFLQLNFDSYKSKPFSHNSIQFLVEGLQKMSYLKSLDLDFGGQEYPQDFKDILSTLGGSFLKKNNLQQIRICFKEKQNFNNQDFKQFVEQMKDLKFLNLLDLNFENTEFQAKSDNLGNEGFIQLAQIVSSFSQLKKLNLNFARNQTYDDHFISELGKSLQNISCICDLSLNFKENQGIEDPGLIELSEGIRNQKKLKKLFLNLRNMIISEKGFLIFGKNVSKLKELNYFYLDIQRINISHNSIYSKFFTSLQQLCQLSTFEIQIKGQIRYDSPHYHYQLGNFLQSQKKLVNLTLDLEYCNSTDQVLSALSKNFNSLVYLKQLKLYFLSAFYTNSGKLTDIGFQEMGKFLDKSIGLVELDLDFQSVEFNETSFIYMMMGIQKMRNLEILKLNFQHNEQIKDEGIKMLAKAIKEFKKLKKFSLYFAKHYGVSDFVLDQLQRAFFRQKEKIINFYLQIKQQSYYNLDKFLEKKFI